MFNYTQQSKQINLVCSCVWHNIIVLVVFHIDLLLSLFNISLETRDVPSSKMMAHNLNTSLLLLINLVFKRYVRILDL